MDPEYPDFDDDDDPDVPPLDLLFLMGIGILIWYLCFN